MLRCGPIVPMPQGASEETRALRTALQFAAGAIADAIYTEDGLDGLAGEKVLQIMVEALKYGTHDQRTVEREEMLEYLSLDADDET